MPEAVDMSTGEKPEGSPGTSTGCTARPDHLARGGAYGRRSVEMHTPTTQPVPTTPVTNSVIPTSVPNLTKWTTRTK